MLEAKNILEIEVSDEQVYACFKVKTSKISQYFLGALILGIAAGLVLILSKIGLAESIGTSITMILAFLLLIGYLTKVLIWNKHGEERVTITTSMVSAEHYFKVLPPKVIKTSYEALSLEFNMTSFEDEQEYGTTFFFEVGSIIRPPFVLYQSSVVIKREDFNLLSRAITDLYERSRLFPQNPFLPSDN